MLLKLRIIILAQTSIENINVGYTKKTTIVARQIQIID